MIETLEMYDGDKNNLKCCVCGKQLADKWINYNPLGNFCINCAQMTMRILFQDIICYHNDIKDVSLLKVMYHGAAHKSDIKWNSGPYENNKPAPKKQLFDF